MTISLTTFMDFEEGCLFQSEWVLSGCADETGWKTLISKHMWIVEFADLSCKILGCSGVLGLRSFQIHKKICTHLYFLLSKDQTNLFVCSDLYLHHYWRYWRSKKSDFLSLQMNVCTEILPHTKHKNTLALMIVPLIPIIHVCSLSWLK